MEEREESEASTEHGRMSSEFEMLPDEMRRLGYQAVDVLVERFSGLAEDVAWRGAVREELEPRFRETAPEGGRPAAEVLRRAVDEVLPLAGRIDHPRFFAFVPSSPTWPSVIADLLASGFNIFQGTWLESAGPSQVELVVLDWFRQWLGMPEGTAGVLTSGGSAANLCALVAARERAGNPPEGVVYVGDQAHSSIGRAARIAGIPPARVRRIATGGGLAMDVSALRRAVQEDRKRGLTPFLVCANAGATNTGTVDPLLELAELCRGEDLWYHVDGAYGGFAVLSERGKAALEGIDLADSVTLDPHKWLFQTFDLGCLLVRAPGALEAAFAVRPEYLQDAEWGQEHVNFADRGLQLTRRFRALSIWMSIQTHGLAAYRRAIDDALDLALRAEAFIREARDLELLFPATLGVVCYRFRPSGRDLDEDALEALNRTVQDRVVRSGYAMVSSTRLGKRYSLRLCVMNYRSTWDDVEGTLRRIIDEGCADLA